MLQGNHKDRQRPQPHSIPLRTWKSVLILPVSNAKAPPRLFSVKRKKPRKSLLWPRYFLPRQEGQSLAACRRKHYRRSRRLFASMLCVFARWRMLWLSIVLIMYGGVLVDMWG